MEKENEINRKKIGTKSELDRSFDMGKSRMSFITENEPSQNEKIGYEPNSDKPASR